MAKQTIAITGIAGYWGEKLAAQLKTTHHIVGIDTRAPDLPNSTDVFIKADFGAPAMADILREHHVSAVCHLPQHLPTGTYNIPRTAKLFSACTAAGVTHLTLKSSVLVYGARADAPAILPEETPFPPTASDSLVRNLRHMEALVADLRREAPSLRVAVLRMAHIIGATVDSLAVRWLSMPAPVALLGFNPLLQLLHEDDAANALAHAITTAAEGTFNIAAAPPLPLSRVVALAGKIPLPLPHPMAYKRYQIENSNRRRRKTIPLPPNFLRYRLVTDTSAMEDVLGFYPAHSAEESVQAFREQNYFRQLSPADATRVKRLKQLKKDADGK